MFINKERAREAERDREKINKINTRVVSFGVSTAVAGAEDIIFQELSRGFLQGTRTSGHDLHFLCV